MGRTRHRTDSFKSCTLVALLAASILARTAEKARALADGLSKAYAHGCRLSFAKRAGPICHAEPLLQECRDVARNLG